MDETRLLAEFTAETGYEDLPDAAVEQSKQNIQDVIGVGLAATRVDACQGVLDYVEAAFPGEKATVLGVGSASVEGAALANGFLCHALDWDDVTVEQYTHLTTQTFPAGLAAAERVGATGRDLLTGYLVGTQVHYRIAESVTPSHYLHGWHTTGTVGTFGAAAAAASVLGLSAEQVTHAFGIAASCSSALRKQFGSMTKAYHAGHSAQSGLRAALLAASGVTADPAILEGDLGYGVVMTPDEYEPKAITDGLYDGWDVHDTGFKPYPGETIAHGAEIALARLVERTGIGADDVATITVTLDEIGDELFLHEEPTNAFQSLYSIEFPLASILLTGEHGMAQFDDAFVRDPATQELMAKVTRDFGFEEDGYDWASARVTVQTTDGSEYTEEELYSPKQLTVATLDEKFRRAAEWALHTEMVERLDRRIGHLETLEDVDALSEAVRGV